MSVPVRQMLVNTKKYKLKCPYELEAESFTVHNTYNDASAENEISYMIGNSLSTSFHYAIDDKEVVQGILEDRNAWAAGDGANGPGNRSSIHIEICYSKSGGERYEKAEALTIKFLAQKLKERGWGIERVKKHEDWSGKNCPHRILDEGRWETFLNAIQAELEPPKPVYWDGNPMKQGQIGRITIEKRINLWKRDENDKLHFVRILEPGERYRVYGYDTKYFGQYAVGGDHWITNMEGYVKYETPSKAKLEALNG